MAGFFPHTGLTNPTYTALAASTFANVLSDIVTDVGAGVNGWTLFDDQRSAATPLVVPGNRGGFNYANGYPAWTCTLNSANASQNYGRMRRDFYGGSVPAGYNQFSLDQTNWYTVSTVTKSTTTDNFTFSSNFLQATASGVFVAYWKCPSYIVLKCTSTSYKTFYVWLGRVGTGDVLRIQCYDTWNASTHTGTNPSPMESLRCFDFSGADSRRVQYILWLLPDAFGLWTAGHPADIGTNYSMSDFFYAGNLDPYRAGDNTALIQVCSNTELSGIYVTSTVYTVANPYDSFFGGAVMYQSLSGASRWNDPRSTATQLSASCMYQIYPRGSMYLNTPDRSLTDDVNKIQICEADAYQVGSPSNAFGQNEGRRGMLRYLKYFTGNPSNADLNAWGPADDGNTYVLISTSYPQGLNNSYGDYQGALTQDVQNVGMSNGWAWGSRGGQIGELNLTTYIKTFCPRFFLMPTNL